MTGAEQHIFAVGAISGVAFGLICGVFQSIAFRATDELLERVWPFHRRPLVSHD